MARAVALPQPADRDHALRGRFGWSKPVSIGAPVEPPASGSTHSFDGSIAPTGDCVPAAPTLTAPPAVGSIPHSRRQSTK
jgi:hypothetical protein